MALYGQKGNSAGEMGAYAVDSAIYHRFGVEQTVITRPADTTTQRYDTLVLMAETGTWRIKPGDQADRTINAATTANATNIFTVAGHGYTDGAGPFQVVEDNTLPTGLTNGDLVYIIVIDANSFKLSSTPGGAEIDITTDGVGTNTITGMPGAAAKPIADEPNGMGTVGIAEGTTLTMQAPDQITVESFGASDVLTYWWV